MCMTFATPIPMFVDMVGQSEYTAKLRHEGIMGSSRKRDVAPCGSPCLVPCCAGLACTWHSFV